MTKPENKYLLYAGVALDGALSEPNTQHSYIPDGEPRIPKIGDVISIYGEFCRIKLNMNTKRQVYKRG